ncbi:hypothetical protein SAMN05216359_1341, partial [Roseateles sp. YR242]|uniref:hypothetical protein n=1 Tax=Roseateles sp. YR242 TaxID=1855305 RepID=UPI0008B6E697
PSPVQATADPVSRKRPLEPDQPGEGPSGIERGEILRQLLQLPEVPPKLPVLLESSDRFSQNLAPSLLPSQEDLLANDPRHQFESAQAAADPVSRTRPLVPDQAQAPAGLLLPWQRKLLDAVPPVTSQTRSAHARRLMLARNLWPHRARIEDLAALSGAGTCMARAARGLVEFPELRSLMRRHPQGWNESDRHYAQRLLDEGAAAEALRYVFHIPQKALVPETTRVEGRGASPRVSPHPSASEVQPVQRLPGVEQRTDAHGGAKSLWIPPVAPAPSGQPPNGHTDPAQAPLLRIWHVTLLSTVSRRQNETKCAYARRLVLAKHLWPYPACTLDIEVMTGLGSRAAKCIRSLADLPRLADLMRQNDQDGSETDLDYARRLVDLGAPALEVCRVFQTRVEAILKPAKGPVWSDDPPVQGGARAPVSTNANSSAELQGWQQTLLALEPPPADGALESPSGHARRLVLAAASLGQSLSLRDLMWMASVDLDAAVRALMLPKRPKLSAFMRHWPQQPSEDDQQYVDRLKRAGAPLWDLKVIFRVDIVDQRLNSGEPSTPHWRTILPRPSESPDRSMLAEGGYTGPPAEPSTAPSVSGPSSDAAP